MCASLRKSQNLPHLGVMWLPQVMSELRSWNSTYGEGGKRTKFDPKLSYFL